MFALFDWLINFLYEYGFYKKSGNLLFLGLDDSGKTTLLHLLKTNKLIQPDPSMHPTVEEMSLGNLLNVVITFMIWSLFINEQ